MRWLEHLGQDVLYGLRQLRLNPGFAAAAILSLALGIGANAAIFQLLNAVRLRVLPVERPQEIVEIRAESLRGSSGGFYGWNPQATYAQWEQIQRQHDPFAGVFAWAGTRFNLAQGGEAQYASGILVSGEYFGVLGVAPFIGRLFDETDDRRGCGAPPAVLSYAYWQSKYGGDPSVIGRKLTLDGHAAEIAGVTPPSFFGVEPGRNFDIATPLCAEGLLRGEASRLDIRHDWWLTMMGRLKAGTSSEQATAYLRSISPGVYEATLPERYNPEDRKSYLNFKLAAYPAGSGVSFLREQYEESLWILLAIAGMVLLIACANLANLMLARASAREREIAIRMALGASRSRLMRQLLSESLLLAAAGALLGGWLAGSLSRALVAFVSTQQTRWVLELEPDWRVLAFTAALAILTCVLFGLAPAIRATRCGPGETLKAGSRGTSAGRERYGLRRALVVTQVALSLVLVASALLFGRSFQNLVMQDTGLRQEGMLVTELDFSRLNVPRERRIDFYREMLARVRAVPGVDAAAHARIVPLRGDGWNEWVWRAEQTEEQKALAWFNRVSEGYFTTVGVALLAGRDFDARDAANAPKTAIVNEAFAKRFFAGASPLGARFVTQDNAGMPATQYEVVGLVADAKYRSLRDEIFAAVYLPLAQETEPTQDATFVVRTDSPLSAVSAEVKRTVAELSPQIGLDFSVLKTLIRARLQQERLMATLSGFFGALAIVLAAVGLYGVISYMVTRRRNEIGIRMALGAQARNVLALVLREAGVLLAVGLAIGTLLTLAAGRAASSMLYGLQPYDAAMLSLAVVLFAAVALAASYLPARRAARLDPLATLREE
ncbi:MAG: ABC transporter permease [Candidatus Acidiferrales bacterium]